jgi:hypothetical protein
VVVRETNARGHDVVTMPRDRTQAVNKLAGLSALAATREWERAALVALLVQNNGRGRPKKNATSSGFQRYNITDFIRLGIYGFRSHAAVDAYLAAWEKSGLRKPEPCDRVELPGAEFPEYAELYGREGGSEALERPEEDETAEESGEGEEAPEEPLPPRPGPRPGPHPETTMLDQFLKVLDHADPTAIIHGQPEDKVSLLIKTLESWIESLRDAALNGGL